MADELEKKYLAEWRLEKPWSAAELAAAAGINRSIISKIESGEQVGRMATAVKIASALGIRPQQILDFEDLFKVKNDREPALN